MCPICSNELTWQNDFTCEDVRGCTCEEGIVSHWICSECEAFIEVSYNCKDQ
jgi:hypothetical protein